MHIFPTILDFVGIDIPKNIDIKESILPILRNETNFQGEIVFSELLGLDRDGNRQKAISSGHWKLISMRPELKNIPNSLFYLKTDPKEQNNLYTTQVWKRNELLQLIPNITQS